MRSLWSETVKRRAWRRVWVAVAEAQMQAGLVTEEQVDDLRAHMREIDLRRARSIEAEIHHDLMAELKTFAEQCPQGGSILHWGLTSADVQDNAAVLRQQAGLTILLSGIRDLLVRLGDQIDATAELPVMGYTHLQPAEPTSLGYRLSTYAQDFLLHFDLLVRLRGELRGKGVKGAVGTSAPFAEMLVDSDLTIAEFEEMVMEALDMESYPISTQTYPRIQDYQLLASLAGLAASMHKFAFDLRLMQSPGFRAVSEPFGKKQVGSSAMPFKRNPVGAEKICSLARLVASSVDVAWNNAANALLERTLDDSANMRGSIPESFLACDEMLSTAFDIVDDLQIDRGAIQVWLHRYGPFSATERLLTALVRAGADRQEMHERLREHSQRAWEAMETGADNPLVDTLTSDTRLLRYLQPARIRELIQISGYLGNAPQQARRLAAQIQERFRPPVGEQEED
jgi:adenylosuccinate lyase